MDEQGDVFDAELHDELEQNRYLLAQRSQQAERKLLVRLLEGGADPCDAVHRDHVVASRHLAYNGPSGGPLHDRRCDR